MATKTAECAGKEKRSYRWETDIEYNAALESGLALIFVQNWEDEYRLHRGFRESADKRD